MQFSGSFNWTKDATIDKLLNKHVQFKIDKINYSKSRTMYGVSKNKPLLYPERYTNTDLKISPYVCVHINIIP